MNYQFVCKVTYTEQTEAGILKRATKSYLVHEPTFSAAEESIYKHLSEVIRGEFVINGIARADFAEIFVEDQEFSDFFEVKARFEIIDEDSAKAKKKTFTYLVTAESTKHAIAYIESVLSGENPDMTVPAAKESPIVDVFEPMVVKD